MNVGATHGTTMPQLLLVTHQVVEAGAGVRAAGVTAVVPKYQASAVRPVEVTPAVRGVLEEVDPLGGLAGLVVAQPPGALMCRRIVRFEDLSARALLCTGRTPEPLLDLPHLFDGGWHVLRVEDDWCEEGDGRRRLLWRLG